MGSDMT